MLVVEYSPSLTSALRFPPSVLNVSELYDTTFVLRGLRLACKVLPGFGALTEMM